MELCSCGHEEVCFDGRNCPVCILIKEHEDKEKELESKINDLENEINDLENEINSFKTIEKMIQTNKKGL